MKFLITSIFITLIFLLLPNNVNAQTCSGSVTCCTAANTYQVCSGDPLEPGYSCTSKCRNSGSTYSCRVTSGGYCNITEGDSLCNYQISGGCYWSGGNPPPASTPAPPPVVTPPGWGGCGSCNWCGGPSGECVLDPNGNCVWDPGSCGSSGGGGDWDGGGGTDCDADIQGLANPLIIGTPDNFDLDINWDGGATKYGVCTASNSNVTLTETDDPSDPEGGGYEWRATGVNAGSVTIRCVGMANSCSWCGDPSQKCSTQETITVMNPRPWWQAVNASVVSRGNLVSQIPLYGCTLPTCNPVLIHQTSGNSAGVAVYAQGSNYDFAAESSSRGSASVPGWLAQSNVVSNFYTYTNFLALTEGMSYGVPGNNLNTGAADSKGYIYYRVSGDYQITNPQTITGKVVLFVDGNLTISERISIPNLNNGFFMAIVGGDIIVSPTVGGSPVGNPDLEGIFFAQGRFNTSSGSLPLQVFGSVYSNQTPTLARDMQSGNRTRPAESFNYVPAMLLNYPQRLVKDQFIWREVAP